MRQNKFLSKFLFLFLAVLIFIPFFYAQAGTGAGSITVKVPASFTSGTQTISVQVQGCDNNTTNCSTAVPSQTINLSITAAVIPPTGTLNASSSTCTVGVNCTSITLSWISSNSSKNYINLNNNIEVVPSSNNLNMEVQQLQV